MKHLSSVFATICMVCVCAFSLCSCTDEEETSMVCTGDWAYEMNYPISNQDECQHEAHLIIEQLNARAVKILGNKFNVECDDDAKPTQNGIKKVQGKLENDKQTINLLKELATIEDGDGNPFVAYAGFRIFCGSAQVALIVFE